MAKYKNGRETREVRVGLLLYPRVAGNASQLSCGFGGLLGFGDIAGLVVGLREIDPAHGCLPHSDGPGTLLERLDGIAKLYTSLVDVSQANSRARRS